MNLTSKELYGIIAFLLVALTLSWCSMFYQRYKMGADDRAIDPIKARALNNRAVESIRVKNYRAAAQDLLVALKFNPRFGEAYTNLGNCYFMMGRNDEALANFRYGAYYLPTTKHALYNLGAALYQLNDHEECITVMSQYNHLHKGDVGGLNILGECYLAVGDSLSARDTFALAVRYSDITIKKNANH